MNWFKRREKSPPYVCQTCGKTHEGLPTDFGFSLPDEVWALDRETRQQHLNWSTDLCCFENRWFLRGVLQVPFQFQNERFGWGIWAEVSEETIARFREVFHVDGSQCPPETGTIANEVKAYPGSFGLPVEVQFGPADKRPLFTFAPECTHPLAEAQRQGLSEPAYHELLEFVIPKR